MKSTDTHAKGSKFASVMNNQSPSQRGPRAADVSETKTNSFCLIHSTRYDFVEIEDPTESGVLGRWCGSQSPPASHSSKGSQIRIRFVSDEYFPSEPGFCIRYSLLPAVRTALRVGRCVLVVGLPNSLLLNSLS